MTRRRRRYRNPSLGDVNTLLMFAALGVAGYVVYKVFGFGKSAASAVVGAQQAAGSKVADWLEAIFPHYANTIAFAPNSTIVLPDGTELTSDLVSGAGGFTATDGTYQIQFYFGGKIYRTAARPDETNTYYAMDASAPAAAITSATASSSAPDIQDQFNMMVAGG